MRIVTLLLCEGVEVGRAGLAKLTGAGISRIHLDPPPGDATTSIWLACHIEYAPAEMEAVHRLGIDIVDPAGRVVFAKMEDIVTSPGMAGEEDFPLEPLWFQSHLAWLNPEVGDYKLLLWLDGEVGGSLTLYVRPLLTRREG